jgi:monoterpene epsilon-lactone hydrolase
MDMNLAEIRSNFEKVGSLNKLAEDIDIVKESIESVTCYWFYKTKAKSNNRVIVYLHGGCFAFGSINSHKALVSHLSKETNSTILFVDYSLAPENPFPAAINDIVKVYNYLASKMKIPVISFIGDSAGPGLITSVVSILNREKNNANLGPCVMLSPWVDLRNNSDSMTTNKTLDPILSKEALDVFTAFYIGKNRLSDANPIENLFGTFPPTLILVGTNEVLLDDSKMLYKKLIAEQPLTELTIYENETHVWLSHDVQSESSKKAIEQIKKFISVKDFIKSYIKAR